MPFTALDMLALIIASICLVELFLRLPLLATLSLMRGASAKASWLIQAKHVSDGRKEQMLPIYALALLKGSITLFLSIATVIALFVALDALGRLVGVSLYYIFLNRMGTVSSVLIAFVYIWLRKFIRP